MPVLTKLEYSKFLESDFWKDLTSKKIASIGRCERCNKTETLQSHHKFYRDDWHETKMEDLEVLCRECHKKEHGITESEDIIVDDIILREDKPFKNRRKKLTKKQRKWLRNFKKNHKYKPMPFNNATRYPKKSKYINYTDYCLAKYGTKYV